MMRLKRISRILFITLLTVGLLQSCDTDSEEIYEEHNSKELIIPVSLDNLQTDILAIESNTTNKDFTTYTMLKWNTVEEEKSFFYKIENIIYEEIDNGISGTSYIKFEVANMVDQNFIFGYDTKRDLFIALPTHTTNNSSTAFWWDTSTNKWISWRSFIYEQPETSCQPLMTSLKIAGSVPTACPLSGYDISLTQDTADAYEWGILGNANIVFGVPETAYYVRENVIHNNDRGLVSVFVGNSSGTFSFFDNPVVPVSTSFTVFVRGKKNDCNEWSEWMFRTFETGPDSCL